MIEGSNLYMELLNLCEMLFCIGLKILVLEMRDIFDQFVFLLDPQSSQHLYSIECHDPSSPSIPIQSTFFSTFVSTLITHFTPLLLDSLSFPPPCPHYISYPHSSTCDICSYHLSPYDIQLTHSTTDLPIQEDIASILCPSIAIPNSQILAPNNDLSIDLSSNLAIDSLADLSTDPHSICYIHEFHTNSNFTINYSINDYFPLTSNSIITAKTPNNSIIKKELFNQELSVNNLNSNIKKEIHIMSSPHTSLLHNSLSIIDLRSTTHLSTKTLLYSNPLSHCPSTPNSTPNSNSQSNSQSHSQSQSHSNSPSHLPSNPPSDTQSHHALNSQSNIQFNFQFYTPDNTQSTSQSSINVTDTINSNTSSTPNSNSQSNSQSNSHSNFLSNSPSDTQSQHALSPHSNIQLYTPDNIQFASQSSINGSDTINSNANSIQIDSQKEHIMDMYIDIPNIEQTDKICWLFSDGHSNLLPNTPIRDEKITQLADQTKNVVSDHISIDTLNADGLQTKNYINNLDKIIDLNIICLHGHMIVGWIKINLYYLYSFDHSDVEDLRTIGIFDSIIILT